MIAYASKPYVVAPAADARHPGAGACQEILRTDKFVVPAQAGTQSLPLA